MPTIRTTFAGLPLTSQWEWDDQNEEYVLCDWDIDCDDDIALSDEDEINIFNHLYDTEREQRDAWNLDERRATRELERGDG